MVHTSTGNGRQDSGASLAIGRGKHVLITVPSPEKTHITEALAQAGVAKTTWINCLLTPPDLSIYEDVDIIGTLLALPPSMEKCPNLKYVHSISSGMDALEKSPLRLAKDIRWTSSAGIHGTTISEWVMMTYLGFEKKYNFFLDNYRQKRWNLQTALVAATTRDLLGQKIGILGYGSVGRQVARVAKAFGMEVIVFTASPRNTLESRKDDGYRLAGSGGDPNGEIPRAWFSGLDKPSLHAFLSQGLDMVVMCLPLSDKTRGMIGKGEFQVLAKHSPLGGAFVSNVSRGAIINQDELIDALDTEGSGVRGAALDVADQEPLSEDSPLWDAANCFISPHISGLHAQWIDRPLGILEQNLLRRHDESLINELPSKRST